MVLSVLFFLLSSFFFLRSSSFSFSSFLPFSFLDDDDDDGVQQACAELAKAEGGPLAECDFSAYVVDGATMLAEMPARSIFFCFPDMAA